MMAEVGEDLTIGVPRGEEEGAQEAEAYEPGTDSSSDNGGSTTPSSGTRGSQQPAAKREAGRGTKRRRDGASARPDEGRGTEGDHGGCRGEERTADCEQRSKADDAQDAARAMLHPAADEGATEARQHQSDDREGGEAVASATSRQEQKPKRRTSSHAGSHAGCHIAWLSRLLGWCCVA